MPLIQCKAGYAETNIAGTTYCFHQDEYGRFVAQVESIDHIMCLTSVEHYQIVPDKPAKVDDEPIEVDDATEGLVDETGTIDDATASTTDPAPAAAGTVDVAVSTGILGLVQDEDTTNLPNPLTAPVSSPAQETQTVTEPVTPEPDEAAAAKPTRKRRSKKTDEAVAPAADDAAASAATAPSNDTTSE